MASHILTYFTFCSQINVFTCIGNIWRLLRKMPKQQKAQQKHSVRCSHAHTNYIACLWPHTCTQKEEHKIFKISVDHICFWSRDGARFPLFNSILKPWFYAHICMHKNVHKYNCGFLRLNRCIYSVRASCLWFAHTHKLTANKLPHACGTKQKGHSCRRFTSHLFTMLGTKKWSATVYKGSFFFVLGWEFLFSNVPSSLPLCVMQTISLYTCVRIIEPDPYYHMFGVLKSSRELE